MAFSELKNPDFYRKTIRILIPVMLQQMITVGINFFDNIMVGSFGEAQIGAASLANQFYAIFQFVCMGLGSGAVVMSSQFWGRKELDPLRQVAAVALRFTLALSILFTVVSVGWPQVILRIYTNEEEVVQAGITYMRLIGCTFLFAGLSSTATYLLRSTSHVRIPLISSIIAFFLNLFFNWVFIFGKLGMPRLEIVGAAVGTVIARAFEFLFIMGYFVFKDPNFRFRLSGFFVSGRSVLRQFFRFSLPVIISDTLLGIGLSLTSVVIGHVSAELVAANAIVSTANQLLTIVNVAMAGASGVVIGNTIGEGNTDRAFREGVAYCVISIGFGVLATILILTLGTPYLRIYSVSQETIETARALFLAIAVM